ncbi:MAG: hypothetical protein IKZ91_00540 [Bacteroidales bacterium]|nr:hypothetical protein [Bacteroidales bacterium]
MNNGINWKTFFVSVLGTAIGVALTFSLNGFKSSVDKKQAQRLTAIMVIHDIDESIESLKAIRDNEQQFDEYARLAMDNINGLETVPFDTLYSLLASLVRPTVSFCFDTSKEMMFNSSMETWHNLGDIKFMDNIQSFFSQRQQLQDLFDKSPIFLEPIEEDVEYQMFARNGMMSQEEYIEEISKYLKNKLRDRAVVAFITLSGERVRELNNRIDSWTKLNDENKFLMGITDSEMDNYLNSMKENGSPVKAADLTGQWVYLQEDDNSREYVFRKDRSYTVSINSSQLWYATFWSGKFKARARFGGTWALKGDSLYLYRNPDTSEYDVDTSELIVDKGKEDSLVRWTAGYLEMCRAGMKEQLQTNSVTAIKARMDSSCDKMEWSLEPGSAIYVKRKVE